MSLHKILDSIGDLVRADGPWEPWKFNCTCMDSNLWVAGLGFEVRPGWRVAISSCGHHVVTKTGNDPTEVRVPWWAWRVKRRIRRIYCEAVQRATRKALAVHLTKQATELPS